MREDQLTLLERLPVVVPGAARDPVEEDVRRRAEEHDGIEAVIEAPLIRDRP
jgi:hypothetical protein